MEQRQVTTVAEAIQYTLDLVNTIKVPVGDIQTTGFQLSTVAANLQQILDAIHREEAAQAQPPVQPQEVKPEDIPAGENVVEVSVEG